MNQGYVKLWRKTEDSVVFADAGLFQTWAYCLLRANHKMSHVTVNTGRGNTIVKLLPGQFIFGRKAAGRTMRQSPETVRDRMHKLQGLGNISIKPATHYSIVTVLNWDVYQTEKSRDRQPTANQPPQTRMLSTLEKDQNISITAIADDAVCVDSSSTSKVNGNPSNKVKPIREGCRSFIDPLEITNTQRDAMDYWEANFGRIAKDMKYETAKLITGLRRDERYGDDEFLTVIDWYAAKNPRRPMSPIVFFGRFDEMAAKAGVEADE